MKKQYNSLLQKRDIQIAVSVFLSGMSCFGLLYYYQSILPALSVGFNVNQATSSLVISAATFGMAIGLVTAMFVADRYNRRYVIGFSLLGSAVLAFVSSYQHIFTILVILNFVKGFLLAGATSVCLAYISEEVSPKRKIKITGFYISGNAIGGMLGRVFSADIAHRFSWQTASEIIGIIGLIFAVLFFVFSPPSRYFKPKKESFKMMIKPNIKLMFDKQLLPYYVAGFLLLGTFVSVYNYMGFFMTGSPFNIPEVWMSYIYLIYITGVFGAMSVWFWEKIFKKLKHILKAMSVLGMLGMGMIFLENIFFVIVGVGLLTYSFFVAHTVCSKMVGEFSKEKKSAIISIYLLAYYMGSGILGSSTGVFLEHFGWQLFLILLIVIFGMIIIVFSIRNKALKAP